MGGFAIVVIWLVCMVVMDWGPAPDLTPPKCTGDPYTCKRGWGCTWPCDREDRL